MKRILALILAVLLTIVFACSSAEEQPADAVLPAAVEQPAAEDFFHALQAWSSGLRSAQKDYRATLLIDDQPIQDMTVRQDEGITEIAFPDIGRVQFSEKGIGLELGELQHFFDLESMRNKIRDRIPSKDELKADVEVLKPLLDSALKEILLPSVDLSLSFGGVTAHVEATDESIRERTFAFVDKLMEERTTLENLLDHYHRILGLFIPDMPQSFDELKQLWEKQKASPASWPDFNITADITYGMGWGGRKNITCNANLYSKDLGWAKFSMDLGLGRDGFDITASLNTNDRYYSTDAYTLDIHLGGNRLNGVLTIPRNNLVLNAEWNPAEDNTIHCTAVLDDQAGRNRFRLEAVFDPKDVSTKAELYRSRSDQEESPVKMASLDLYTRHDGWDGALTTDLFRFALHRTISNQYNHLKAEISSTYSENYYADLWTYREEGSGIRVKLDTNFASAYHPRIYNLVIKADEIGFSRLSDFGQRCDYSFRLTRKLSDDGFEYNAEYLNLISSSYSFYTGDRPSTLKLVRDGQKYQAELDWSIAGRQSFMIFLIPHQLIYTDRSGRFEISVFENTAEKLEVRMVKNGSSELARLALVLAGDRLLGILSVSEKEIARVLVEPIDKEPVRMITKTITD